MPRDAVSRALCQRVAQRLRQVQPPLLLAHTPRGKAADLLCAQADAPGTFDLRPQGTQSGAVDAARCGEGRDALQGAGQRRGDLASELAHEFAKGLFGPERVGKRGLAARVNGRFGQVDQVHRHLSSVRGRADRSTSWRHAVAAARSRTFRYR